MAAVLPELKQTGPKWKKEKERKLTNTTNIKKCRNNVIFVPCE
jgi:hypothetical protein